MTHAYSSRFEPGQFVLVDGDTKLRMRVIGVWFQRGRTMVEVAWFDDGVSREAWLEEWRLEAAPPD